MVSIPGLLKRVKYRLWAGWYVNPFRTQFQPPKIVLKLHLWPYHCIRWLRAKESLQTACELLAFRVRIMYSSSSLWLVKPPTNDGSKPGISLVVDVQEAEELAALPVPSTLSLRLHSLSFSDSELQERDTLRACLRSGLLQSSWMFF